MSDVLSYMCTRNRKTYHGLSFLSQTRRIKIKKAPKLCIGALNLFFLRREQDSNLRTGFAGYTLSRRASSTTRAPLQSCLYTRFLETGCKGTN